jgi:hypothetical protein
MCFLVVVTLISNVVCVIGLGIIAVVILIAVITVVTCAIAVGMDCYWYC